MLNRPVCGKVDMTVVDLARAACPSRSISYLRRATWYLFCGVLSWTIGTLGCSATASTKYAEVPLSASAGVQASSLGPGDEFEVRVYEEGGLSGVYVVSPGGQIDYPLLGTLTVEGLVPSQVAALIRSRLADKYIRNPYVTVQARGLSSKRVMVLGEVKTPGRFTYSDRMTVVDAMTLAGGFTSLAERNYTIVTRTDAAGTHRIAVPVEKIMQGVAANFFLQPGDIVFVPETIL